MGGQGGPLKRWQLSGNLSESRTVHAKAAGRGWPRFQGQYKGRSDLGRGPEWLVSMGEGREIK